MNIFQKGFHYAQDGPGNRLVYHLGHCNMHCPWCSNPEGMDFVIKDVFSPTEIADECMRSQLMFFDGGGVTFTGGEPTMQFDELKTTLALLHKEGIHTAMETNGTHEKLPLLFPLIDFLMMDFKHYNSHILKQYTGVGNECICQNFKAICESGRQALIRIPLICGFNTDTHGFIDYFNCFDTKHITFELLPYHEYGKGKWRTEYKVKNGFISAEMLSTFQTLFKKNHLNIIESEGYLL